MAAKLSFCSQLPMVHPQPVAICQACSVFSTFQVTGAVVSKGHRCFATSVLYCGVLSRFLQSSKVWRRYVFAD